MIETAVLIELLAKGVNLALAAYLVWKDKQ